MNIINKKESFHIVFLILTIFLLNLPSSIATTDSNITNNQIHTLINISEGKESFEIIYVRIRNSEGELISEEEFDEFIEDNSLFLQKTFPLADDALIIKNSTGSLTTLFMPRELLYLQLGLLQYTSGADIVVGVLPYNTFVEDYGISASGESIYFPSNGSKWHVKGVLTESIPQYYGTGNFDIVAHETSHTFGMCDEIEGEWESQDSVSNLLNITIGVNLCPNGDINPDDSALDSECTEHDLGYGDAVSACRALTFRELHPFDNSSNNFALIAQQDVFRSFMGYFMPPSRTWISKATYEHLSESLAEERQSGEGLLISALVYKNGSYTIMPSYKLSNVPLEEDNSNTTYNYSVKIFNSNNSKLFEKKFQPSFISSSEGGITTESNVTFITFAIPYNSSISYISFNNNNVIQQQFNRSPNTPIISLISPLGSQIFENPFNISWNASDIDNDTLTYFVQISNDGGTNWLTIAVDLNQTENYLQLNNADFSYGSNYRARVYVSDGVNTNFSSSTSSFTIIPPPSISINNIEELYTNGTRKVYEISIENDGGQNLSNLAWRLNTGISTINSTKNISLAINEEAVLLFELEYTSGGWINVSFFAYDEGKTVNDTLSEEFFIGDLRIESLSTLYEQSSRRIFELIIVNNGSSNLSGIGWNVNLTDGTYFGSSSPMSLSAYESAIVIFEREFSDSGTYTVRANTSNSFNSYEANLSVTLDDISISNFAIANQSDETVIYIFRITNDLIRPVQINYSLNTGLVNLSNSTTITSQNYSDFQITYNYTQFGTFAPTLRAWDNYSHNASSSLSSFDIVELSIASLQKLSSNGTNTVFEFVIENKFNRKRTLTWSFDTNNTAGIISSTRSILLQNNTDSIPVILSHNFSSLGSYSVMARANTSLGMYSKQLNLTLS